MQKELCNRREHELSRRQWLGAAALGIGSFGGLASGAAAEAMKRRQKQVCFIWLDGGMCQLESWDPKPDTQFGGPFRAIPTTVPGVHLSELLPKTAKQMQHLAVVRSLHTKDENHSSGVARIQRGDPKNRGVTYPYFGSAIARLMGPGESSLPPYVWINPSRGGFIPGDAGFLGAKYGALAFGDGKPPENMLRPASISDEENEIRNALRLSFNRRYAMRHGPHIAESSCYVFDVAHELMKQRDLFDDSKYASRDVERYGAHDLGRHMLLGRRMLESGVRFVKVSSNGWDSHGDHFNASRSLVGKFDQPFAALIEDLAERGMLDSVLVIVMSEFGRSPKINSHVGRDHWPEAWSMAMAGCGLRRGIVVGATDKRGTFVETEEFDAGHLFHTWFQALGLPSKELRYDNGGQPLPIAHDEFGSIAELLA